MCYQPGKKDPDWLIEAKPQIDYWWTELESVEGEVLLSFTEVKVLQNVKKKKYILCYIQNSYIQ